MNTNTGGPAFPIPLNPGENWTGEGNPNGMTLRDYFAAKAMQAAINYGPWNDDIDMDQIAKRAYKQADAMLEDRNK